MKKIITILLIASLTGCSKSNPQGIVMIEYKYTADVSSTYNITYTNANSVPQTVSFTGTTWSQTLSASAAGSSTGGSFEEAFFSVNCTASPTPTLNGKMTIYADNKDVQNLNVPLAPGAPTSFSISYLPFTGH